VVVTSGGRTVVSESGGSGAASGEWPVSPGRFWLLELRVFQTFLEFFYRPPVQNMETQLKALPTLLSSLGAFCLFQLRVF